jgi:hypothetical protein
MNQVLRLSLILLFALLSVQCASNTRERRIERNLELLQTLGAADQDLVRQGRIRPAMNKDAVFLAWGRPDRISSGYKDGKNTERWIYTEERVIRNTNIGFGMGGWGGGWGGRWGGACGPFYDPFFMGGPNVSYMPFDAASVDFIDGKVVSWEAPQRR